MQFLKELLMSGSGYVVGTFWVICERTLRVFLKKYLMGKLMGFLRVISKLTHSSKFDQSGG